MASDEVFILYGSQTGQAESISENIQEEMETHGIKSTLLNLKQSEKTFQIITESILPIVFVCSTTGDGEVPGNVRKFMRILGRKTNPATLLANLRYALLGLGDTNYSTFCGGPKTLEKGLKRLGARSFYPTGYADDGTDLELVVEPWIEGLWDHLKRALTENDQPTDQQDLSALLNVAENLTSQTGDSPIVKNQQNSTELEENFKNLSLSLDDSFLKTDKSPLRSLSKACSGTLPPLMKSYIECVRTPNEQPTTNFFTPYPLATDENLKSTQIVSIQKLTSDDAIKTAYCVTLDIGNDFVYEPGDAFGVVVKNPTNEVDWLIKRLSLEGDCDATMTLTVLETVGKKKIPKYLPTVTTIRQILENYLEIRSVPKRTFLRALYEFTSAEDDKRILRSLCQKESTNEFAEMVREPSLNLLDLLAALPSCLPSFELLIEHLPRIKARLYSAASAFETSPRSLSFVFNVVEFPATRGRMYPRQGIFTGFMDNLYKKSINNEILSIFMSKNLSFRLPKAMDKPLVMIGPGTGVAPFIGFLELLNTQCARTPALKRPLTWLFFGCRHNEKDFLFRDKLEAFKNSGVLHHLVVSYSRHPEPQGSAKEPKYVQDNLRLNSDNIFKLLSSDAVFYVCGDARNMAKDVRHCILDILSQNMSPEGANDHLQTMVKEGRYKEDIWT